MKYKFTTARIVVLIAMVNLVVAVLSLTLQPFARLDPGEYLPMVVFCLVTFPLLTFIGTPIITSTSMWAIPSLYLLLVLNAVLWGIVGVYGARMCGWLYRIFWLESDGVVSNEQSSLKWDVLFVVFTHSVLFFILLVVLVFLIPVAWSPFTDFGGKLPLPAELLDRTSFVVRKYLVINLPLAIGFLFADGRVYSRLCRQRGKKAGTIWAVSVTMVILLAIVWYTTLVVIILNTMMPGANR